MISSRFAVRFSAKSYARSAREGPTIHAFTHSLSTVLVFLREVLSRSPPTDDALNSHNLSTIWMHYEEYELILIALSSLYGRVSNQSTPSKSN